MLLLLLVCLAAVLSVRGGRVFRSFQGDPNLYYCGGLNGYMAIVGNVTLQGLTFAQVQNVTSFYGFNLVNVDNTNIDKVLALFQQCLSIEFNSAWIGYYQALESPFGCSWSIGSNGHDVVSSGSLCANGTLPMIAMYPGFTTETDSLSRAFSTTTVSKTRTLRITTTETTLTNYITLGNLWVTETVTVTEIDEMKKVKEPLKMNSLIPFAQCSTQMNNYTVVYNADTTTYQTTYDEDCNFYGLIRGNLTTGSLFALSPMLSSCTSDVSYVVFNSFNGYVPLCGQVNSNMMIINDFKDAACTNPVAVLCFGGNNGSVTDLIRVNTLPPTTTVPGATNWSIELQINNIDTTTISRTQREVALNYLNTRTYTITTTTTSFTISNAPSS